MSKKILIIFWGHPLFDGRVMNMINQLITQKYEVCVLGVGLKSEKINYKNSRIKIIDNKLLQNRITKYFRFFKYVKQFISKNKPNVIIASDLYSMIPSAKIKYKQKTSLIYDSRELYTKLGGLKNKSIIQKIWSYYEKKYINVVDHVLVTANVDKQYLTSLYPDNLNISIIKNLPGNSFINPEKINLKKMLCIDEKQTIFLYQGKFHEGRGIRFSIQCLSKIQNAVLVLIGNGRMKEKYLNEAVIYNMTQRIFFVDQVPYEQLARFSNYGCIGLSVIQPISKSYENALPNKLFEYAVSGIPVICSNLIEMKKMINAYHGGISINHQNKLEFIEACNKIINNYDDYVISKELHPKLLWESQNITLKKIIEKV